MIALLYLLLGYALWCVGSMCYGNYFQYAFCKKQVSPSINFKFLLKMYDSRFAMRVVFEIMGFIERLK